LANGSQDKAAKWQAGSREIHKAIQTSLSGDFKREARLQDRNHTSLPTWIKRRES